MTTANVDDELAVLPGPQLVVPATNARYALNAANARWGSLYDALYGTDAIPEDNGAGRSGPFNPLRAMRVVARARAFLDEMAPLTVGSHADAVGYCICGGRLAVELEDGVITTLNDPTALRRPSRSEAGALRGAAGQSRPACRDRHRPHPPHRRR